MKLTILILTILCCSLFSNAQQIIKGNVTDSKNIPLVNASIKTKDGSAQTRTDSTGHFSLRLSGSKHNLIVSYVGYQSKEIPLNLTHQGTLTIVLETNASELEEVVVSTGYQSVPKERATGAFTTIDNKTFNEQVGPDVLSRLEAVANGVNVDRTTLASNNDISVRGLSTISGPKSVLIVVDNFPYEGDINNINPNDVEKITILKDAAAASIWGARAGNGVIVITTKRGNLNQPLKIDFNSNLTVDQEPDLFYQPKMSSTDYIDFEKYKFSQGYKLADTSNQGRPGFSPVYEILLQQLNGSITDEQTESMLTELAGYDIRQQYEQYMYKPGLRQQYAVNMSGGTGATSWYFSTGYDNNVSALGAGYDRLNLNFQNTYRPARFLRLDAGLSYTQSNATSGRTGIDNALEPYTRLADENGNALAVSGGYRKPFRDTLGGGKLLDWNNYPLTDADHIDNRQTLNSTVFNVGINYAPLKWINADIKYQYERQRSSDNDLYGAESYFARDMVNKYSQFTPGTGEVKYIVPPGGILDIGENELDVHNLRGQLNINQQWEKHEIYGLAGAELRERAAAGHTLRRYGYDAEINSYAKHDPLTTYPNIVTGSRTLIPSNDGFSDGNNRFLSAFGNMGYIYDKRYVLTVSARKDASNLFGVNTNDKWNLLWSAGAGWNISNEDFYKSSLLPYLKFRATLGYSGNVDPGKSAITTIFYGKQTTYTSVQEASISQFANPELRWEKVRMINIAADFRFKNNRVFGSIDFFFKRSTDLYGPSELDYTAGAGSTITKNVASLGGHGLDIDLNTVNIDGAFQWTTNVNFSFYKDKVLEYYLDASESIGSSLTGSQPNKTLLEGKPLYSMLSLAWGGLDPVNGNPIGFLDKKPSQDWDGILRSGNFDDMIYHGSAIPTVYGSIGNTFTYKRISLTARLLYKLGYYFRRESIDYMGMLTSARSAHPDYLSRWKQPGDEVFTDIPSFLYPAVDSREIIYTFSEKTVERGDNIRLQYININYLLDQKIIPGLPFKQLNVYLNASNIGILWRANKAGIDPNFSQDIPSPGMSISLGLRINL